MDILDFVFIIFIVFCVCKCCNSDIEQEQLKKQALKEGKAHLEQDSGGNIIIKLNPPTTSPSSIEQK